MSPGRPSERRDPRRRCSPIGRAWSNLEAGPESSYSFPAKVRSNRLEPDLDRNGSRGTGEAGRPRGRSPSTSTGLLSSTKRALRRPICPEPGENNARLRARLKETHRFLRKPDLALLPEDMSRHYLPLTKIVDTISFQDKTD